MTDLSAQKRLASDVLDVGKNRVWFDPDRQGDIADAITREDVRDLVTEGVIQAKNAGRQSVPTATNRVPVPAEVKRAHDEMPSRTGSRAFEHSVRRSAPCVTRGP